MNRSVITPVPSKEVLGVAVLGSSWTIPTIQPYCPCGRPIGTIEYEISKMRARAPGQAPDALYRDVSSRFDLKMCCQNLVLNRVIRNIVSADIGAFSDGNDFQDAPPPTTDSEMACPPPLI